MRELAKKYMEFATSEKQRKRYQRGLDNNDLIAGRPPVTIEEIPWYQMNIGDELTCICEDEEARKVEYDLRTRLYRIKHFDVDGFFDPFWRVRTAIDETSNGLDAKEDIRRTDDTNHIVSHEYEDVLDSEEALSKIVLPKFTLRPDIDERNMNFYTDLLGDAMPVKLTGVSYVYCVPWDLITRLCGITPILYDMYDNPELLHAIMEKFMEEWNARLDFIEKYGKIDANPNELHCTSAQISGLAE